MVHAFKVTHASCIRSLPKSETYFSEREKCLQAQRGKYFQHHCIIMHLRYAPSHSCLHSKVERTCTAQNFSVSCWVVKIFRVRTIYTHRAPPAGKGWLRIQGACACVRAIRRGAMGEETRPLNYVDRLAKLAEETEQYARCPLPCFARRIAGLNIRSKYYKYT